MILPCLVLFRCREEQGKMYFQYSLGRWRTCRSICIYITVDKNKAISYSYGIYAQIRCVCFFFHTCFFFLVRGRQKSRSFRAKYWPVGCSGTMVALFVCLFFWEWRGLWHEHKKCVSSSSFVSTWTTLIIELSTPRIIVRHRYC